ncbi:MAG TPA: metabolite traffic protein EboE [Herpetosiphonaceae bacterium]|nr:metabolite traffic protein EboE [Herpetosiphonaceae bacterium]
MQIDRQRGIHLTYCTNIHPAAGWDEVFATLRRVVLPLKARLSPGQPFGIGLRLSGQESRELLAGDRLAAFRAWLDAHGLYVFTLNGFPYAPFHHQRVKDDVHAPDWRDPERVAYTLRLIEILAALLPAGVDGGISTSPLSYKPWFTGPADVPWAAMTEHVVAVAEALVRLRAERGVTIHLDIEPEPDGLLADSRELVEFFERLLGAGAESLARRLGCGGGAARNHLRTHIQACLDTCHCAVAYEQPGAVLARYAAAGITVGKVQLSSALQVGLPRGAGRETIVEALAPFAEGTYLHQVIQRNQDGSLRHFPDLPPALAESADPQAVEWRIHFHVPIFLERYGALGSTQAELRATLEALRQTPFCAHLEIETYTWEVLPADLKLDLADSIAREYEWVRDAFL